MRDNLEDLLRGSGGAHGEPESAPGVSSGANSGGASTRGSDGSTRLSGRYGSAVSLLAPPLLRGLGLCARSARPWLRLPVFCGEPGGSFCRKGPAIVTGSYTLTSGIEKNFGLKVGLAHISILLFSLSTVSSSPLVTIPRHNTSTGFSGNAIEQWQERARFIGHV